MARVGDEHPGIVRDLRNKERAIWTDAKAYAFGVRPDFLVRQDGICIPTDDGWEAVAAKAHWGGGDGNTYPGEYQDDVHDESVRSDAEMVDGWEAVDYDTWVPTPDPIFSREALLLANVENPQDYVYDHNVDHRDDCRCSPCLACDGEGEDPLPNPERHPVDHAWDMLNERMCTIRKEKAAKYTSTHPLDNYNNAAAIADTSVEQHMLGRCQEKITRISNILKALERGDIGVQEVEADLNNNDIPDIAVIMQLVGASLWARVHAAEEN